jgi:hypothetical protein
MRRVLSEAGLALALLLCAIGFVAAQAGDESFGVPIFPGAEPNPELARALEAYYGRHVAANQRLVAAVFETPASFQEVHDFYGPRMEKGKWGWRKKERILMHQTETLKFYRAQLIAREGEHGKLPHVLAPLIGDVEQSQEAFEKKLQSLLEENEDAKIQIVEGTRRIQGDPSGSVVRITVERPYIDLERMRVVDKTRILLVKVSTTT